MVEEEAATAAVAAKIDSMQKYVPFLSKLIARLDQEPQNAAKVVQMQLLYKILINTEESVSIEELNKCEEALEAIYRIYETTPAVVPTTTEAEENTLKEKQKNQEKGSLDKEIEIDADDQVSSKSLKITKKETTKIVKEINTENDEVDKNFTLETIENSEESKVNKTISDEIQQIKGGENDKSKTLQEEMQSNDKNKSEEKPACNESVYEKTDSKTEEKPIESKSVEEKTEENPVENKTEEEKPDKNIIKESVELKNVIGETEKKDKDNEKLKVVTKEKSVKDKETTEPLFKDKIESQMEQPNNENKNSNEYDEENMTNEDEEEEEELDEENVELIKMPEEADDDEMILPDSADESKEQKQIENKSAEDDTDNEADDEENENKDPEKDLTKNNIDKDKQNKEKKNETDQNKEDVFLKNTTDVIDKVETGSNHRNSKKNVKQLEVVAAELTTTNEGQVTPEEPELVALHEDATSQVDEDDETEPVNDGSYDPLTCEETKDKSKRSGNIIKGNNDEQVLQVEDDNDDDDDVELIETRNSPICLDSDDDEVGTISPPPSTKVPAPTATSKERTFARKSTAKPAIIVPQIQKKTKNLNYLQNVPVTRPQRRRVVDTIDLLDSSDEESSSIRNRNKRTHSAPTINNQSSPAKRQLLSALKKNNNKKSQQRTQQPPPQVLKRTAAAISIQQTPRPVHLSTPQSNFLNAVQLQPAFAGANPAAFSTQLSNKNVIIPNAFYGNPIRNQSNTLSTPAQRGRPRLVPKDLTPTSSTLITADQQQDRIYSRWLENFLTHFSHPQHIASHSCFVLLQRVLKYKLFMRIKTTRIHLNTMANNATEFVDIQLMLDLRNVFYTNAKQLSDLGRAFCKLASSHLSSKPITLTTEASTGRVSSRTRTPEEVAMINSSNGGGSPNFSGIFNVSAASSGSSPALTASARKRQYDDVEYKPDKAIVIATECNDVSGGGGGDSSGGIERKRTLRTNRTRRFDNNFSYNEDEDPHEFEDEDDETEQEDEETRAAKVAVQRIIEKKRLEAQKQRERQAKSFESAFINAFAKHLDERVAAEDNVASSTSKGKRSGIGGSMLISNEASCSSSEASVAAASSYLTHDVVDAEENNEHGDSDSLGQDDEPVEHRIYKVIPAKLTAASAAASVSKSRKQAQATQKHNNSNKKQIKKRGRPRKIAKVSTEEEDDDDVTVVHDLEEEAEIITCDDFNNDDDDDTTANQNEEAASSNNSNDCIILRADNTNNVCVDIDPAAAPRNTDRSMCARSKNNEWCVICNFRTPRIVHHYVNLHRGCEVYTARLADRQLARLRRPNGATAQLHKYKNGQQQFEAACPFCEKTSRFMLPYWYQHFTMHTGEYAYRCSACGIRKPTRSLLVAHINIPCTRRGSSVLQDFTFDARAAQIEARICMLCNYVQLQRANVVAHLKQQHGIKQILPKHIQSIVLLKQPTTTTASAQPHKVKTTTTTAVRGRGGAIYEIEEIDDDDDEGAADGAVAENPFFNYDDASTAAAAAGNWDDGADPSEDLSFMICGMLDVQMNTE